MVIQHKIKMKRTFHKIKKKKKVTKCVKQTIFSLWFAVIWENIFKKSRKDF